MKIFYLYIHFYTVRGEYKKEAKETIVLFSLKNRFYQQYKISN